MPYEPEVALLGSLVLHVADVEVPVRGMRQPRLVAALALDAGRVVSVERLVDIVWPDTAPATARRQIQDLISRVRLDLVAAGCAPGIVATHPSGYVLQIPPRAVDALRFRHLVSSARVQRHTDAAAAADMLRAALALWRGDALDGLACAAFDATRAALTELRLDARELYAALEIGRGHHEEVLGGLSELVELHPLHERLVMHQMRALHGAGRTAEALQAFHGLRQRLADELGLRPGAEIQRAFESIIRDKPEPHPASGDGTPTSGRVWIRPAQLPPDVSDFAGRTAELAQLHEMTQVASGRRTPAVVAIVGAGGVGKTALALRFAHTVADRFEDGVVYANLRGWSAAGPAAPLTVLTRFLRALGVEPEAVPPDLDEATALYRSLLADRRLLLLVDNAANAEQVRPILPAGRSVVVVTSRDELAGLAARDGARRLHLDLLTPHDSLELLRAVLGPSRVASEPAAAAELAHLCVRLPLALRIAAADLTARPGDGIAAYVERLRSGNRLSMLELHGDEESGLRAVFSRSLDAVHPDAQQLFRLVGAFPADELSLESASVLADVSPMRTRDILDRLVAAHLVQHPIEDRYTVHDLLRSFAREICSADDATAMRRLLDSWLRKADAAARLLYPSRIRLAAAASIGGDPASEFPDDRAAVQWLDLERTNLWSAVGHAATHGPAEYAGLLTDALRGYLGMRHDVADARRAIECVVRACAADNEHAGGSIAELGLAEVLHIQGDGPGAEAHLNNALLLAERAHWPAAKASAHINMGGHLTEQLRLRDAERHLTAAADIHRQIGWSMPALQVNLGLTLAALGRFEEAAQQYRIALSIYETNLQREPEALALTNLADVERQLGHLDQATAHAERAVTIYRDLGQRRGHAEALTSIAAIHLDADRADEALGSIDAATDLATETGDNRVIAYAALTRGTILTALGRGADAVRSFTAAAAVSDGHGFMTDPQQGLADAYLQVGNLEQARSYARRALTLAAAAGSPLLEAAASASLAAIHRTEGDHATADRFAGDALETYRRIGHRLGERRAAGLLQRAASSHG
jgi:DNA-binding SARP family transcriptional activator/Tfp pilus assembly protein PilF